MREKILRALKTCDGFVSGEELSRGLSVSRAAVWKCIEDLRADGYGIQAVPHYGYRLAALTEKLLPEEIQSGLGTRRLGGAIRYFDTIPSTMDEAFQWAMDGAPEGALIVTETQTKGRGRMGRQWLSPKGRGLYFSLVLRPDFTPGDAAQLTLLAAVAVSEAVEQVSGVRPLIKWPNDLLLGNGKLAGILTELRADPDRAAFVVAGVGINVNTPQSLLPPGAVSIKEFSGRVCSRARVLQGFLRSFESYYFALGRTGWGPVHTAWTARSATIGRKVRFEERGRQVAGIASGLALDGGLLVETSAGKMIKRMAGDIHL